MNNKTTNIALYFGSFNPLHFGHLAVAEYVVLNCEIDRFFMVLSPHNPFKDSEILINPQSRLINLKKEIKEFNKKLSAKVNQNRKCKKVEVSDIEFHLEEPLYTYNTLKEFEKKYPQAHFIIVVGADSIKSMHKWYKGEDILLNYKLIVYPREGYRVKTICKKYKAIYLENAPLQNISSTQIRNNQ